VSIKLLKKQGGFTLLELLIVIVIIGILALLIIPNITSAPKKARDTSRKADITTTRKALEEYFVSNNAYPVSATAANITAALVNLSTGSAPILKTIPKDPKDTGGSYTGPYRYMYTSADGSAYSLTTCLENDGDNSTGVTTDTTTCPSPAPGKKFLVVNGN